METELDDTSVIESSSYSAPNLLPNINQTADGDVLGGGDDGSAFIPGSSGPSPPPPLLPSVPDYVCCVVTEGVWTWFAAILLIVVLFSAATLKYCKKRLSKPKFNEKNRNLLLQYILEADKGKRKKK